MRDCWPDRVSSGCRARLTPGNFTPYNAVHNGDGQIVRRAQILGALFFFSRAEEAPRRSVPLPQVKSNSHAEISIGVSASRL